MVSNTPAATAALTQAAAFDRRKPDPATLAAWSAALDPGITPKDAADAVVAHYATSSDWLMPAHVNHHCLGLRKARIEADKAHGTPVPVGLGDDPMRERRWKIARLEAIAQGCTREEAEKRAYTAVGHTPMIEPPRHYDTLREINRITSSTSIPE